MFLPKLLFGLALFACVAPASAGTFTMNSPVAAPGDSVTVVVTFAGDGVTQDAQWDLGFDPALFQATAATVLVPESICVFSNELGLLRTVPPSGAGAAVTSVATQYCSFDLAVSASASPIAHVLTRAFLECTPRSSFNTPPCVGVPGAIVVVDGPEVVVDPAPGERLIIDRIDGAATTSLVTISNIGIAPLTLSVDAPAAPFSALLSSQTLAPGDSTTLTVACNATAEGFASSTITLHTNDSNEPAISYAYRCYGGDTPDVHSVPAPGPRGISDLVDGVSTSSTTTIFNQGSAYLTLTLDQPSSPFTATLSSTTIAPGRFATLTVTCSASAATSYNTRVRIATNDLDEPLLEYHYGCTGTPRQEPEIQTSPLPGPMIISDPVDGAATTETIVIRNFGVTNLSLAASALAPPFSQALSSTSLPAMALGTLAVSCNATAAGPVTTTVILTTNDLDEPTLTFTVTCTGSVGPTPEVVVDTFRRVLFARRSGYIEILNIGTAPLTLSIQSSVFPAVFSSTSLAPGASATLSATCDIPEGAPPISGATIVTTNDLDEPTLRFTYDCYPASYAGVDFSPPFDPAPLPDALPSDSPLPIPAMGIASLILLATSMLGLGLVGPALRRRAPMRVRVARTKK